MRLALAGPLLLALSACGLGRTATTPAPGSMADVYSSLGSKCGESVPHLIDIIDQGAVHLQNSSIAITPDLLAVVLDNALPPSGRRVNCSAAMDKLFLLMFPGDPAIR